MTLSHRPFGTEHPYRHDLDQRVPTRPIAGQAYEIRVLADPSVATVDVVFADGSRVSAQPVDPADVICDFGAPPAPPAGAAGHLTSAANAVPDTGGQTVWVASAVASADTSYVVRGGDFQLGPFDLRPLSWQSTGGTLRTSGIASSVEDVEWLTGSDGPRRVRFALRLSAEEHVVGFGERYHALDQRGEVLDAMVFEQYKRQGHRTYLPMPFALVTGGSAGDWGFHVQTTRRTWYDVGAADPGKLLVEAEIDPADPSLSLRLHRGEPGSIVREFLLETGMPPQPPEWIFRPWMSGNEWNTQERVLAEVRRSLAEQIPVGAVVIEAWSDEATFVAFRDAAYEVHPDGAPHRLADFTFPADGAWPDPKAMIDELHAAGVKVLLWQIPLVPTDRGELTGSASAAAQVAADAATMIDREYAIKEADGRPHHNRGWWFPGALLPDWTNPDARRWWLDKRRYLLEDLGVDGFKTDGGEHAWGHDLQYFDGSRGDAGNNLFAVRYAQAYHDLMGETGTDGVTFSRAGFTGAAAFPAHWAGDENSTWEAFRASITAGLTAGVGGIFFWGWDLAGFSGDVPDAELYLRSAAAACFAPIMQYHSEFNHHREPSVDRTPWNIADRSGTPDVVDGYRRFARLREELVPYLAEQSARSIETGRPLMRPLFFDHPGEPEIWNWPRQWRLGDDLLVAPVTSPGVREWPVYLPEGEWADYFTGVRHTGPAVVTRAAPLDEIPVYRRLS
ncbi:alpha-glucosidase (family GH31 glycosyl hydrolase) [Hamadaea flava]|uniref:TIM-barrel domain-containing protein n=1 Tax=Hamadaea flava TaxID=1742688 RepID=A0ABV8LWU3_9ACTN|nr:TIM-barrel domain-containing protein [Hamadaea flava]MCP2324519.1 alpha-glucosidase (family GH31 glycosyl hydrolase) [Hamadaea flava]